MNKNVKVGLLSLIAIMQVSTIIAGFFAYQQMYEMLWKSMLAYKELVEETGGRIIDYGLIPNPFVIVAPLIFLGLFATIVLLIDEVSHKSAEN